MSSYLRLSINSSDLNERVFSYDDMPDGQTDPELKHFDLSNGISRMRDPGDEGDTGNQPTYQATSPVRHGRHPPG